MFNETQTRTLCAAMDAIVPPDDETPGAQDADVLDYLLTELNRGIASQLPLYYTFLDALEQNAQQQYERPFAELDPDTQTTLLLEQTPFVNQFAEHVTEGFYISPAGLSMVGFQPVKEVES